MPQTNPANPLPDSANATPSAPQPAFESGPKPDQNKAMQQRGHLPATGSAATDPDLVDRIFEYILAEPAMAQAVQAMDRLHHAGGSAEDPLRHLKNAVRQEFSGERCYITAQPTTERQEKVAQVLRLFNGRNASEVARRLQISKMSVYRYLKQARPPNQ